MRRRARADANQSAVTKELRALGVFVEPRLSRIGEGVPDLLVAWRGHWLLVELKDGSKSPSKRRLTDDEQEWIDSVQDRGPVVVAETTEQIVDALLGLANKGWAE